jgi:catechol 2,3-dioxygenase-like lactoylglutathione lyase family enzyme
MLDYIFLAVSDLNRSIAFYQAVLPKIQITARHDFNGDDGPAGHPDLRGFGANGRLFFWLRQGAPAPQAVHVGFVAHSEAEVRAAYAASLVAGA